MLAWHFLSEGKRLGFDDGRVVEVGVPLECKGEPALCSNGMHGSIRLIDALAYASGPIVCRVDIEGNVIQGDDKLCGRRRTVLWMLDATRVLHEFACECAEDALALIDNPDPLSVAAVAAKRRWLNGEITDVELAAACAAARGAAARAVARAVARANWAAAWASDAAAWSAACAAADAAAWAAGSARATADAAARAVGDAAWTAAIAKQDERLTEMVMEAHKKEKTK